VPGFVVTLVQAKGRIKSIRLGRERHRNAARQIDLRANYRQLYRKGESS
jgi:hypothetical protein